MVLCCTEISENNEEQIADNRNNKAIVFLMIRSEVLWHFCLKITGSDYTAAEVIGVFCGTGRTWDCTYFAVEAINVIILYQSNILSYTEASVISSTLSDISTHFQSPAGKL